MAVSPKSGGTELRALVPEDLARAIEIDAAASGQSRRRFFEKRFDAARRHPDEHLHVGAVVDGKLAGFALARLQVGEFGRGEAVAVLDAIGVDHDLRDSGLGHALLETLAAAMRQKGVYALKSQAEWNAGDILRFFAATGFRLAPRLILERPVALPLDERRDAA